MSATVQITASPAAPNKDNVSLTGCVWNTAILSFSQPVIVTGPIKLNVSGLVQTQQVQISSTCVCITFNGSLIGKAYSFSHTSPVAALPPFTSVPGNALTAVNDTSGTFSTKYDPPYNGIMAFTYNGDRYVFAPACTWCINNNATGYAPPSPPSQQFWLADPLSDNAFFPGVNDTVNNNNAVYCWPSPFHVSGFTDLLPNPLLALKPFFDLDGVSFWEFSTNAIAEFQLNYAATQIGQPTQTMLLDSNTNPIGSSGWLSTTGKGLFGALGIVPFQGSLSYPPGASMSDAIWQNFQTIQAVISGNLQANQMLLQFPKGAAASDPVWSNFRALQAALE